MVVIIPTCYREDSLRRTLNSLLKAVLPRDLLIHVVENGSKGRVEQLLCEYQQQLPLVYHHYQIANKSEALNCVVNKLEGNPLIVFFDDDVDIDSECLMAYFDAAKEYSVKTYFGGPAFPVYEKEIEEWKLKHLPLSVRGLQYPNEFGYSEPKIFFLGFNWATYKSNIQICGGFDSRFGPGSSTQATGQESQMIRQLSALGIVGRYVPRAKVKHYISRSSGELSWIFKRNWRYGIEVGLISKPTYKNTVAVVVKLLWCFVSGIVLLPLGPKIFVTRWCAFMHKAGVLWGMKKKRWG